MKIDEGLIFFLMFLGFLLSLPLGYSCHLESGTYYSSCTDNIQCDEASDCGSGAVSAYDWARDWGGCDMGCAAGKYYDPACVYVEWYPDYCSCGSKEAKWTKSCSNGATCKVKWGLACEGEFEGKWDASEGKCVECGGKVQVKAVKCGQSDDTTQRCESACGADSACDEKNPCEFYDPNGDGKQELYCAGECKALYCDSSHECWLLGTPAGSRTCQYYITSDGTGHWWWNWPSEVDENGDPWQECFDGHDNDCDGMVDCSDSNCDCALNGDKSKICVNGEEKVCTSSNKGEEVVCKGTTYYCDGTAWVTSKCDPETPGTNLDGVCDVDCGADSACDEKNPDALYDPNGDGYKELYCGANCLALYCDSSQECDCLLTGEICQYYISSDGSGHWLWNWPNDYDENGSPWQECFDGHDNDCDGKVDCSDSNCDCVLNGDKSKICVDGEKKVCSSSNKGEEVVCKGTTYYCDGTAWVIRPKECTSDADCTGYDPETHLILVCDCPEKECSLHEKKDYTCKPKLWCDSPSDCDRDYCCDKLVGGSGHCVDAGSIVEYEGKSWLCDPPAWVFIEEGREQKSTQNVFELLINLFSKIFS